MRLFAFITLLIFFLFANITAQYSSPEDTNGTEETNEGNSVTGSGDFMIIGIPDTQYYTENGQGSGSGKGNGDISTFYAQMNWIKNHRIDSNIVYVAHLGDCVENGDNVENEWKRADTAMSILENISGLTDGIPYGIAVGNHDMTPFNDPGGSSTTTFYNQYFGVSRFSGRSYYAGHWGSNNDNHYDLFSVGSLKFIVIYIKYAAYRNDPWALHWADSLLNFYSDRKGIVVSHKLLNSANGTQVAWKTAGKTIYDSVKTNPNLFLMLCGHYTKDGRRTDIYNGTDTVYTLLSDYQEDANGGDGYMRLMRFSPTANKISVYTYSPTINGGAGGFKPDPNGYANFTLNYDVDKPLPVELAFFAGTLNGNKVELRWRTETEVNNYGFEIERSTKNSNWTLLSFVEGHGNSNSPKRYSYIDTDIGESGTYYYRLKQIDNDGTYEYSNVVRVEVTVPEKFQLSQNYPNPFNPSTRIDFKLPKTEFVSLRVYNLLGELVQELLNEEKPAGSYSVNFNAADLPSGVYIYRLESSTFSQNRKMTLIK